MSGTAHFKEPIACTEGERREFARLVRQGFEGSDEGLHGRIRDAKRLAFYYAAGDTLAAVAAIKTPNEEYRDDVFKKADARVRTSCVFATTRPDNISMIRILLALGFEGAGKPYPRRNEELVLFLRSRLAFGAPRPGA